MASLVAGGCFDEADVAYLNARSTNSCQDLACSSMVGNDRLGRRRKLDYALAKAAHVVLQGSNASLCDDVVFQIRAASTSDTIREAHQCVWAMLD